MAVLWLLLLAGLSVFLLGVLVWAVLEHFLTAEVPSALQHRAKLRFLHCGFLYVITLGNVLEKLRICSMPSFVCFVQDKLTIKRNPEVLVSDLRFGTIPVRLFQPKAASSTLRRGILFFHGGGAMIGSLDSYHNMCSFLARETDSVVLSVGYSKVPGHHYPAIFKDCLNVSIHFLRTLEAYRVDPSRVIVCGESAGGGFVALVTQALAGRTDLPSIRAQVLIYPCVQLINFQLPSFQQYQNVPVLSRKFMMTCVCKYLAIDLSWQDAMVTGACLPLDLWNKYRKWLSSENLPMRFRSKDQPPETPAPFNEAAYLETEHMWDATNSPLMADDETFAQLPEACLVSCELDIIRDDTLLYKKRLEDQGVRVTWYHVEDGFHGCLLLFDKKIFSFPCSLQVVNAVVSYIKGI